MASSPGPSTPDNVPRRMPTMNRSFTLPAKVTTPTKASNLEPEIGAREGIETLFQHPNTKLLKFTATTRSASSGSLSWQSPTERTMAAGELRIYRVPGSVSFLSSGDVLHTIMPRSNCWCVDGVSKFVLRVLPDTYYRIELPAETDEDIEKVEEFKITLPKVCFYEKTPCPFARTFSVDLPDEPEVVKKGKRRKSTEPAKKWKLDRVWRPEGWVEPEKTSEESASGSGSPAGSDEESDEAATPMEEEEPAEQSKPATPTTPMRQRALAALRSASTPQVPVQLSTPPSRLRTRVDLDGTIEVSETVTSASGDSGTSTLRTFQAIPTDMPPSPPDSSAGLDCTENRGRGDSDTVAEPPQLSSGAVRDSAGGQPQDVGEPIEEHIKRSEGMQRDQSAQTNDTLGENLQSSNDIEQEHQVSSGHGSGADKEDDQDLSAPTVLEGVAYPPARQSPDLSRESDAEPQQEIAEDDVESTVTDSAKVPIASELDNLTRPRMPQASLEAALVSEGMESQPGERTQDTDDDDRPTTPEAHITEALGLRTRSADEERSEADGDDRPRTPENQTALEDPYAAIQARILARRSLSGTVSFHPGFKSPTRQSTSSTSSTATISSTKSALSRRSHASQHQQAFASAMVKKAYNTFLGPPAHLVAIMLQIAARCANGAFGVDSMFYVESPIDSPRKVPGGYYLSGGDAQELDSDFEEEEDDFGVPLRSPTRLKSRSESSEGARERRRWDVD